MQSQFQFTAGIPGVSELTNQIKSLLESNFQNVLVEGELSNVKESRNGHLYFTIKDSEAQLPCVMWSSTRMRIASEIRDGQQVILGGDIQLYPPHGRYQLIVSMVEQAGTGRLQQKFEELKQKLEKEGLFREEVKKPLPSFPMRVGIITSSTGAAFHDIRDTFERRWPAATLYLHHASVQGVQAAGEIADAIQFFSDQEDPVDLLIAGRGGGSLEDLWPFNEEIVARAIFNCRIPVISAVGHEVDFTISDFVADVRAATPTQAVILATPDINELRYLIEEYTSDMEKTVRQQIHYYKESIQRLARSHELLAVQDKIKYYRAHTARLSGNLRTLFKSKLRESEYHFTTLQSALNGMDPVRKIDQQQAMAEQLTILLNRTVQDLLQRKTLHLQTLQSVLAEKNPKSSLEKGYTRILQDGKWIKSSKHYKPERRVQIEWHDGKVNR